MATRFQPKGPPGGRFTPSNLSTPPTTNSTLSPSSPSTYVPGETDQIYLGKIQWFIEFLYFDDYLERLKAKEIISEAFLQVARIKPDDPIDFLYS